MRRLSRSATLVAVALATAAVTAPLPLRAQPAANPWARYTPQFKAEGLLRAADGGDLAEARTIVDAGADVNWQHATGTTALHVAAAGGQTAMVRFLLGKGADASLRDNNGYTALDRARMSGARDVVAILEAALRVANPAPAPAPAAPVAAPAAAPVPAGAPAALRPTRWAPFGRYAAGARVRFWTPTGWRTGTVQEVGVAGPTGARSAAWNERKYSIADDRFPTSRDWYDWGTVAGIARDGYWTDFFVGDWQLGEAMAVNARTDGREAWNEYAFQSATEALRVTADGRYEWKTAKATLRGRWVPAADGPGIVLQRGVGQRDWTLFNATNANEENIRGLETARLAAPGQLTINARRPAGVLPR